MSMRLTGRTLAVLGALLGIVVVGSTDQIVPATSEYEAQMRVWLVARASGLTAYLILTFVIAIGLVLSHPVNKTTWKLSKQIFPWHENLFVFVIAFLAAHVVSIVLDPWAGVGLGGAFVPGISSYRSVPVALGTLAMYGLLITGLTARYTKLLPPGLWLRLHRFEHRRLGHDLGARHPRRHRFGPVRLAVRWDRPRHPRGSGLSVLGWEAGPSLVRDEPSRRADPAPAAHRGPVAAGAGARATTLPIPATVAGPLTGWRR